MASACLLDCKFWSKSKCERKGNTPNKELTHNLGRGGICYYVNWFVCVVFAYHAVLVF